MKSEIHFHNTMSRERTYGLSYSSPNKFPNYTEPIRRFNVRRQREKHRFDRPDCWRTSIRSSLSFLLQYLVFWLCQSQQIFLFCSLKYKVRFAIGRSYLWHIPHVVSTLTITFFFFLMMKNRRSEEEARHAHNNANVLNNNNNKINKKVSMSSLRWGGSRFVNTTFGRKSTTWYVTLHHNKPRKHRPFLRLENVCKKIWEWKEFG